MVVDVRESLWETMTKDLGLTSSNLGCDRAQCGACTVVVDGLAMNGCTLLTARLGRGQQIMTVDSLSMAGNLEELHPIQRAYVTEGGHQCALCTRGFVMSTYALLEQNPDPNEAEVAEALSGNICRCGNYPKIYDSVFKAAEDMRAA
jgi:aerobic-type carbon monoxide dehydrogenase small subunit (CoxS/CutS family)